MFVRNNYLFHGNQLCIPRSLKEQIIHELHGSGLGGHLRRNKPVALVEKRYYWPQLKRFVRFVRFVKLPQASLKIHAHTYLYQFQNYPRCICLWILSCVFCELGEVWTLSLWLLIGILRQAHFIPYKKMLNATQVTNLFFNEVFRLHGVPQFITFDCDTKFLPIFGKLCGSDLTHFELQQYQSSAD